jgi:hypothetical protein
MEFQEKLEALKIELLAKVKEEEKEKAKMAMEFCASYALMYVLLNPGSEKVILDAFKDGIQKKMGEMGICS